MRLLNPLLGGTLVLFTGVADATEVKPLTATPDFLIQQAQINYHQESEQLIFEMQVQGLAGNTIPSPNGQIDGAPVLAYVFITNLKPQQVGFAAGPGTLALVATSHPDFDDTPLWDENGNGNTRDAADGAIFHSHWVTLIEDQRVEGGLSVKPVGDAGTDELPATAPGMPIYLDSPGFPVLLKQKILRIPVPRQRIRQLDQFRFDAVSAYLQVNQSQEDLPTLGVYKVYSVLSGDLSLPYQFTLPAEQ